MSLVDPLKETVQSTARKTSREIIKKLSSTQIYKDYQKAFTNATEMPLALKPIESFDLGMSASEQQNPFCALMARTSKSCAACLNLQAEVEKEAVLKPATLYCFAGLCETAVPVQVGNKLIGFLKTGQVFLHQPNKETFSKAVSRLLSFGIEVDLKSLEEAYYQSKVLDEEQYSSFVRLLSIFAEHLGIIGNYILIEESLSESDVIKRVKAYISDHSQEHLTLEQAAKAVNISAHYFCKIFKQSSGMTFTDYLARVRIEKAKNLLANPQKHIGEIGFEVGFESLSQFNRSFKRITGETPTLFRKKAIMW